MATKSYALSKKKVREMIFERFEGQETIALNEVLALFASAERAGSGEQTTVLDDEGNVIGKRCSYFGVYLPISEFGTMGKDDEGNIKYSYQSKEAQKCIRDKKKEVEKMNAEAEEMLDAAKTEEEKAKALDDWREAKSEIAEYADTKCKLPEHLEGYETIEEFKASL